MSSNKPSNISSDLLKTMGLDASQLDTSKVSTSKRVLEPSTKTEHMKVDARVSIKDVNARHGKEVTFQCLSRDGKTKDGKPKYRLVNQSGTWCIDKSSDGTLSASRVHYYTETFKIVDYIEEGTNSDTKHLDKEISKASK